MEIGYWVGEKYWGRGIATEAVGVITKYAFQRFDIIRLYADIFAANSASARVLEKNKYVREALLQSAVYKDGKVGDIIIYSRLK